MRNVNWIAALALTLALTSAIASSLVPAPVGARQTAVAQVRDDAARLERAGLEGYVRAEMEKAHVPGLALAVVKNGEIVFERGFGTRDLAKNLPVTTDTVFSIASLSKSFTAISLATLVEEGRLDWDAPVRSYAPDFTMFDAYASEHVTARDLLTHRTGLPGHARIEYNVTDLTPERLWHDLAYLEPNAGLREAYQYNNLTVGAAGYLAGRIAGEDWADLVAQRIFQPVGMADASLGLAGLAGARNHALGYARTDGRARAVAPLPPSPNKGLGTAPAGGVNASIHDMARYLMLHLGDGTIGGHQVLSPATFEDLRRPVAPTGKLLEEPEFGPQFYAMGLFSGQYRGHRQITHSGLLDGYTSLLTYLPDDDVGIILLTNLNEAPVLDTIPYYVFDRLLGLDPIDWSARQDARNAPAADARQVVQPHTLPSLQHPGTHPSHPLADYVGRYSHPAYGVMEVTRRNEALSLRFAGRTMPLDHYHYDVFHARTGDLNYPPVLPLQFVSDLAGNIVAIRSPLESAVSPIVLARLPDPALADPDRLKGLTGTYELGRWPITIARNGDALNAHVFGEQHELIPVSGTRFRFADTADGGIEFMPAKGDVPAGLVLFSTWGDSFAARR